MATMNKLDQFEALEKAATSIPWVPLEIAGDWGLVHCKDGNPRYTMAPIGDERTGKAKDDMDLAAAARNLAPQLIRLARATQRLVATHREASDWPTAHAECCRALAPLLAEVPDA